MFIKTRTHPQSALNGDSSINECLLETSSLVKDEVYDAAGNCLGQIEEIVFEARTGCVRYAVLGLGGFFGIGQKRLAVPWRALTPDANYRRCVVDVTLMRLMAVPVPPSINGSSVKLKRFREAIWEWLQRTIAPTHKRPDSGRW